jgi:hypothetical protein
MAFVLGAFGAGSNGKLLDIRPHYLWGAGDTGISSQCLKISYMRDISTCNISALTDPTDALISHSRLDRRHGRPIPPSTTRCQASVQGRRLHQLLPKAENTSPLFRFVLGSPCLKKIARCVAVCCRIVLSFILWPDYSTFDHYTISCLFPTNLIPHYHPFETARSHFHARVLSLASETTLYTAGMPKTITRPQRLHGRDVHGARSPTERKIANG